MTRLPILYSFRRCPYAMRARMALLISGAECEIREVKLANKPQQMVEASPKGTVPILVLQNGAVIDESLDVMRWALRGYDPEGWLATEASPLIELNDGAFKHHLDRYKYPQRHKSDPGEHRASAIELLLPLEKRLKETANLYGARRSFADMAIVPFVRQFAETDRAFFDAQNLPGLQAWLGRHLESALFVLAMRKLEPWKPSDAPVLFRGAA